MDSIKFIGSSLYEFQYKSAFISAEFKYAMFDLDGTLVTTKSGKAFPIQRYDWKMLPNRISKLKEYHNKGYRIYIVSNKLNMSSEILLQIEDIIKYINIPLIAYVSTKKDWYRKPNTQVATFLSKPTELFFCGDAAGRKNDHSDSDRAFAYNLGIFFDKSVDFYTESEMFNNEDTGAMEWLTPLFIPNKTIFEQIKNKIPKNIPVIAVWGNGKELLIEKLMKFGNRRVCKTLGEIKDVLKIKHKVVADIRGKKSFEKLKQQYAESCLTICFNLDPNFENHMNNMYVRLGKPVKKSMEPISGDIIITSYKPVFESHAEKIAFLQRP